ncbi:uncharacterized protein LY89DRAFT_579286 [Mollisia scopiformis]|uniref:RBR-type E3 ubiquitin transferase n=1 Tax=Mollisia scopiformis TaxID=149040 RepID=A0A194XKZ8_MOLSC|nr:uncharacterized protein LY89DRAFT_579286 [Mollisia scopiformis]KUJ20806.1 hypothetical protein LY89DRAFT_579286 [Mollisia scopiformis]
MIQFISTLSLVEYNQPPPKAVPAQPGTPDPFREFFLQLQAHATPGLSSWGKSPAKGKIPGLRKDDTAKKQECVICVEEKPLQHFPKITDSCQHPDQICLVCVQNWLAREADNTDWDKIHCVACKEIVPYNHMKRLMTKAAFEKYDQYSRNATLSKMPNFRWCISSSCSSGQIHEIDTDGYIFYCGACYTKTCVIHNVPWHEGETCTEYDYRQDPKVKAAEERASKIEIKGSSKPCPGPGCKVNITRNGGCEHMKCELIFELWDARVNENADSRQVRDVIMSSVGSVWRISIRFGRMGIRSMRRVASCTRRICQIISIIHYW